MLKRIFFIFLLLTFTSVYAKTSYVKADLLSSYSQIVPGQTFVVAIAIQPKAGWHSYWKNPGDTGAAPLLHWLVPGSLYTIATFYQPPKQIKTSHLTNYGYSDKSFIFTEFSASKDLKPGETLSIQTKLELLICQEECIPQFVNLELFLKTGTTPVKSTYYDIITAELKKIPENFKGKINYKIVANDIYLKAALPSLKDPIQSAYFFPEQAGLIRSSTKQQLTTTEDNLELKLQRDFANVKNNLKGILHIQTEKNSYDYFINAPPYDQTYSLAFYLKSLAFYLKIFLFALLGGLILNIMPCVFPVLSLKVLSLVHHTGSQKSVVRWHSLLYTAGVISCFIVFAAITFLLQTAGQLVGWGFQMQSPLFVMFMALLFFLIGLNLLGFFEIKFPFGFREKNGHHYLQSYSTGLLAALVATPCTAPFMGIAIGFAISQSPIIILLIFISLGIGLALPFLVLVFWPSLLDWLPRPGQWMITVKELLAFPIFAASIWLLWVLTIQVGLNGLLVVMICALTITFIIWLNKQIPGKIVFSLSLLAVFFVITQGSYQLFAVEKKLARSADYAQKFSPALLTQLQNNGKAVFVNATAAWCITCKVNEEIAMNQPAVKRLFSEGKIVYLVADWTNKDPEITKYLRKFSRNGVPLYVYYPVKGKPVILPQILTESLLLNTLK